MKIRIKGLNNLLKAISPNRAHLFPVKVPIRGPKSTYMGIRYKSGSTAMAYVKKENKIPKDAEMVFDSKDGKAKGLSEKDVLNIYEKAGKPGSLQEFVNKNFDKPKAKVNQQLSFTSVMDPREGNYESYKIKVSKEQVKEANDFYEGKVFEVYPYDKEVSDSDRKYNNDEILEAIDFRQQFIRRYNRDAKKCSASIKSRKPHPETLVTMYERHNKLNDIVANRNDAEYWLTAKKEKVDGLQQLLNFDTRYMAKKRIQEKRKNKNVRNNAISNQGNVRALEMTLIYAQGAYDSLKTTYSYELDPISGKTKAQISKANSIRENVLDELKKYSKETYFSVEDIRFKDENEAKDYDLKVYKNINNLYEAKKILSVNNSADFWNGYEKFKKKSDLDDINALIEYSKSKNQPQEDQPKLDSNNRQYYRNDGKGKENVNIIAKEQKKIIENLFNNDEVLKNFRENPFNRSQQEKVYYSKLLKVKEIMAVNKDPEFWAGTKGKIDKATDLIGYDLSYRDKKAKEKEKANKGKEITETIESDYYYKEANNYNDFTKRIRPLKDTTINIKGRAIMDMLSLNDLSLKVTKNYNGSDVKEGNAGWDFQKNGQGVPNVISIYSKGASPVNETKAVVSACLDVMNTNVEYNPFLNDIYFDSKEGISESDIRKLPVKNSIRNTLIDLGSMGSVKSIYGDKYIEANYNNPNDVVDGLLLIMGADEFKKAKKKGTIAMGEEVFSQFISNPEQFVFNLDKSISESMKENNKHNKIKAIESKIVERTDKVQKIQELTGKSEIANLVEELKRGTITLETALNSGKYKEIAAVLIVKFLEDEDLDTIEQLALSF